MLFFTADTHFGHRMTIERLKRPFKDLNDMHEGLAERWNEVVKPEDTVHHLGDLVYRMNAGKIVEILKRLNGKKYLCASDYTHDRKIYKNKNVIECFEEIKESFLINVTVEGFIHRIYLHHYAHLTWPYSHYGSWHLFGHSHGRLSWYEQNGKLLDVGVDTHDWRPWSLDEVAEVMRTRPLNPNDTRRREQKPKLRVNLVSGKV